jgi:hypothetical protein
LNNDSSNTIIPGFQESKGGGSLPGKFSVMLFPLLILMYFAAGFTQLKPEGKTSYIPDSSAETLKKNKFPELNIAALLANEQFSMNLRDTVYTDKDVYLEVRIDRQMLYVHFRNGTVKEFPISSGIAGASKSIESRPGLFAIFMKEELHLSTQFNSAKMYYFMPYNMGIGFHGLAGTGYYGHLGVRPSSHGCIRMRTPDAKELFKMCEVGTLVLSHRGKSARVIAFAPEGFKNDKEYSKEEYMEILAYNLNSVYEGKYFTDPPKRFIIDPSVIPKIGFNVGTTDDIPGKQNIPILIEQREQKNDNLSLSRLVINHIKENFDEDIAENFRFEEDAAAGFSALGLSISKEQIDKLVYNRAGILPYFPPSSYTLNNSSSPTDNNTPSNSDTPSNNDTPTNNDTFPDSE